MQTRIMSISRPSLLSALALAAASWFGLCAPAAANSIYPVLCGSTGFSTLLTAKGFPAGAHEDFTIAGRCSLQEIEIPGKGASTHQSKVYLAIIKDDGVHPVGYGAFLKHLTPEIAVIGRLRWTRADQTADELLTFAGPVTGTVKTHFTGCYANPYMLSSPGCGGNVSTFNINVNYDAPADVLARTHARIVASLSSRGRPLFWRHYDAYTAEALSKLNAPAACPGQPVLPTVPNCPQPEPPTTTGGADGTVGGNQAVVKKKAPVRPAKPKVATVAKKKPPLPAAKPKVATVAKKAPTSSSVALPRKQVGSLQFATEAEALLGTGALKVKGGKAAVQQMSPFGPHWSGNKQVVWIGGRAGSAMTIRLAVSHYATYVVQLGLTKAPDFADLAFEVNGKRVNTKFSGFAPGVVRANVTIGKFTLKPGTHTLRLRITGKKPQSSNFLVGVDQVVLTALPSG